MYLTKDDYTPVCSARELEILQQSDTESRIRAESTALEEVAGYLRTRFDMEAEFAREGKARNAYLVQVCVNITLYYLVHWLPGKMSSGNRTELYENAVEWLEKVQAGKVSPALPLYGEREENKGDKRQQGDFPMLYGSMGKSRYDW